MKSNIHTKAGNSLARLIPPLALLLAAVSFTSLTGCLFGDSSEDGDAGYGEEVQSVAYTVSGDLIITPASDDVDRYCDGDSMISSTYHDDADTVTFSIAGNVLSVVSYFDTTETGAITEWTQTFTRTGSGSGLEGFWTINGRTYRILSGTLSAGEKARYDQNMVDDDEFRDFTKYTIRFAGGRITTFLDRQNAKAFIWIWNGGFFDDTDQADSARYDIAVKEVDRNTVELKGRKSGETVRIEETLYRTTYTSDQAGHATHIYYNEPETCPNEDHPEWYYEFKYANFKAPLILEKSGEFTPKKRILRQIPFVPLKSIHSLLN